VPSTEIAAEETEELPDWLREITPVETQAKSPESTSEIPPLPDWLSAEESGEVPAEEEALPVENISEEATRFSWQPEITPEIVSKAEEELPAEFEMTPAVEEGVPSIEMEETTGEITPLVETATVEPSSLEEEAVTEEVTALESESQPEEISAVEEIPQLEKIVAVEEAPQPEEITAVEETPQLEEIAVAEEALQPAAITGEKGVQVSEIPVASETDLLSQAQTCINKGNIEKSVEIYNQVINQGENMDQCIQSLREALYRYPVEITLWQALGDACMREDRIQEALDAYTKAEELLQ
jgi:hypothetical protein